MSLVLLLPASCHALSLWVCVVDWPSFHLCSTTAIFTVSYRGSLGVRKGGSCDDQIPRSVGLRDLGFVGVGADKGDPQHCTIYSMGQQL